jgi:hypothetical protein
LFAIRRSSLIIPEDHEEAKPILARIVVKHDDPAFRECVVTALQAASYEIKAFAAEWSSLARMAHEKSRESAVADSCCCFVSRRH